MDNAERVIVSFMDCDDDSWVLIEGTGYYRCTTIKDMPPRTPEQVASIHGPLHHITYKDA